MIESGIRRRRAEKRKMKQKSTWYVNTEEIQFGKWKALDADDEGRCSQFIIASYMKPSAACGVCEGE